MVFFLNAEGYVDAAKLVHEQSQDACKKKATGTSASRLKRLPEERLATLFEYLVNGKGPNDKSIALWLYAGQVTGLRPSEWPGARFVSARRLKVRNAKYSHGRSFDEFRTLDLTAATEIELHMVQSFVEVVANVPDFEAFLRACQTRLRKVNRKRFPTAKKHITLYSARHQFGANCKAANLADADIAALFDHGSNETARFHYARARHGRGRVGVRPDPEDVAKVIAKNNANPTPQPTNMPTGRR